MKISSLLLIYALCLISSLLYISDFSYGYFEDADFSPTWVQHITQNTGSLSVIGPIVDDRGHSFVATRILPDNQVTLFGQQILYTGAGMMFRIFELDTDGMYLQSKDFLCSITCRITSIAVNSTYDPIVVGGFSGTLSRSNSGSMSVIQSSGASDGFILQDNFASSGGWLEHVSGTGSIEVGGVVVDTNDNIYIAGSISKGSLTLGSTTITDTSWYGNGFTAKYDTLGTPVWLHRLNSWRESYARRLTIHDDMLVLGGYFREQINIAGLTVNGSSVSMGYIIALDLDGVGLWQNVIGGGARDWAEGVISDGSGNTLLGGRLAGSYTFSGTTFTSQGTDGYLVQYNSSGDKQWFVHIRSPGTVLPSRFARLHNRWIALGGFSNEVSIGGSLLTGAASDQFIVVLDDAGVVIDFFSPIQRYGLSIGSMVSWNEELFMGLGASVDGTTRGGYQFVKSLTELANYYIARIAIQPTPYILGTSLDIVGADAGSLQTGSVYIQDTITLTGSSGLLMSLDAGVTWTSGTINAMSGDVVLLGMYASYTLGETLSGTITIDGYIETMEVTTSIAGCPLGLVDQDGTCVVSCLSTYYNNGGVCTMYPFVLSSGNVIGVDRDVFVYTTGTAIYSGIISTSGTVSRSNDLGNTWNNGSGSIQTGDTIVFRMRSSVNYNTTTLGKLYIDTFVIDRQVTTKPEPIAVSSVSSASIGGGGGGGGGNSLQIDQCDMDLMGALLDANSAGIDYSSSQYDRSCGTPPNTNNSEQIKQNTIVDGEDTMHGSADSAPSRDESINIQTTQSKQNIQLDIFPSIDSISYREYNNEQKSAYTRAFQHSITTLDTMQSALPRGYIYRRDMAKMIVSYAKNVLGKDAYVHDGCVFGDITNVNSELQEFIVQSCKMGLMGVQADGTPDKAFRPSDIVTRAEYGTILSRLLFGDAYNVDLGQIQTLREQGIYRYSNHLQALSSIGIMNVVDSSMAKTEERRVNAWIVMQRTSQDTVVSKIERLQNTSLGLGGVQKFAR